MARLSTRQIRRMFKNQRILHTIKGIPQYVGDSYRALRWGRRIHKDEADRNTITTRDGVPKNTHWDRPLMHGWRDPTGHWKRFQRISQSTSAEVDRLVSKKGGYVIRDTETDIRQAARLGYKVLWIEPKTTGNMLNQAIWDKIAGWGHQYGITLKGYTLPGNNACLPYMNKAGIKASPIRKRK